MPMTLEIKNALTTRMVTIDGEGAIDDANEARRALDAAGDTAALSTFTVDGVTRSYAQIVGFMRLGSEAHRVAGVEEYFHPEGTSWDSVSNNILANAARFDNRPHADGSVAVDTTATPRPMSTPLDAASLFAGSNALPAGATVTGVDVTNASGQVVHRGKDANIPATALSQEGSNTVRLYYKVGSGPEMYRDAKIRVGELKPIEVPSSQNGAAYGVVPTIPNTAVRPALIPGVAAGPTPIGDIEVTASVPQGALLAVYADGNEKDTIPLQPNSPGTDHKVPVTVPGSVGDGPHQIGLRIRRAGQAEIRFNDRPVTIGPATKFAADPVMGKSEYKTSSSDTATVTLNMTEEIPSGVTISVNGRPMIVPSEFSGKLAKGNNTVTLRNKDMKMKNNVLGVAVGTYPIVITLPGGESKTAQLVIK